MARVQITPNFGYSKPEVRNKKVALLIRHQFHGAFQGVPIIRDEPCKVHVLAIADGWAMVREIGGTPFVCDELDLQWPDSRPPH